MKRALTIVFAVPFAALIGGAAVAQMGQGPRGPMAPEQMGQMMEMMTQHQEMMKQYCPGATSGPAPK